MKPIGGRRSGDVFVLPDGWAFRSRDPIRLHDDSHRRRHGGSELRLAVAGTLGLVQLARFWRFDRKPFTADGDLDAAAMAHGVCKVLDLKARAAGSTLRARCDIPWSDV